MAAKPKEYQVTALYVTFKTQTSDGIRYVGLYQNAPVPADVPQEQLDHHLKMGLIHEKGWTPPDPADTSAQQAAPTRAGCSPPPRPTWSGHARPATTRQPAWSG